MANISVTLLLDDQHMAPPVDLVDGTKFPRWLEAWATVDGTPVLLWIIVESGRPVLQQLTVSRARNATGPLKASTIHDIPIDQVVRQTIADVGQLMERVEGRVDSSGSDALLAYGRRTINDDLLRSVAAVVKADRSGMSNQAVQATLHTSSRNASRWIALAKKRGFLTTDDTERQD